VGTATPSHDRVVPTLAALAAIAAVVSLASDARPYAVAIASALGCSALVMSVRRGSRHAAAIGERARAESSMRRALDQEQESLRMLSDILDAASEGLLALDANGALLHANAAAKHLLGDRTIESPSARRLSLVALALRALNEGLPFEEERDVHLPARRRFALRAVPFDSGAVIRIRDITEISLSAQVRRDFVANVSHELKTPVSGIVLLAEQLTHALDEDRVAARRFAEHIASEADRLTRLVADLLDLSRLETDLPLALADIDALQVMRDAATRVHALAEAKQITLMVEGSDARLQADPGQVATALTNLLDNAVRYAPSGSSVRAEVIAGPTEVAFVVRDEGPGIPSDQLNRVFERFYRVDKARARSTGGTGLGLAIVKHVADRHGGNVSVDSEVGLGSTFTLAIPMRQGTV
jgi:two-component system, OmpR family, sensor histidine kinase SenX3